MALEKNQIKGESLIQIGGIKREKKEKPKEMTMAEWSLVQSARFIA